MRAKSIALLLSFAMLPIGEGRAVSQTAGHTFAVQGDHFALDGKPFQIISGEMHYPRIPRHYWRSRLRMARAMGLNTITTYVFWNLHEPRPDAYDFSGNNDIAEFVREAQQEGLYVILRPGPYVCAEWELGGYPAWLLKDHRMLLRSSDPSFMVPATRWLKRLGEELAPLQIGNGGSIILTQVENEYGSFAKQVGRPDPTYMQMIKKSLVAAGFTQSQLYTADGPEVIADGSLPGLPVGINFGGDSPDSAKNAFETLKQAQPQGPFINSEYWSGWFDHWGGHHAVDRTEEEGKNLDYMLKRGYSVSIYMFHGGTSFGWMNGANDNKEHYEPDVSSYDYAAALDEGGRPTPKYYAFRKIIEKTTGITPPPVPETSPVTTFPRTSLVESASLWNNLPKPIHSKQILSMEDIDQAYGYILYRTRLPTSDSGDLVLNDLHSYAVIYLDGHRVGALDRRFHQNKLALNVEKPNAQLDILVENTGRVNFGESIRGERAGITKSVTLGGKPLLDWDIYPLPMTAPQTLFYSMMPCSGPCFYRGHFTSPGTGDTFLDTSNFHKGELWLNGHALGRIWDVGPQRTLYAPGPWQKTGTNEVIVFDVQGHSGTSLSGLDKAILDDVPRENSILP